MRIFIGDMCDSCIAANRPIGREKTGSCGFFVSAAGECTKTPLPRRRLRQKTLEDFVREQAAMTGQSDHTSLPLDQARLNEFVDDRREDRNFAGTKVGSDSLEIYPSIQAQAEKESFLDGALAVNEVGLE